MVKKVPQVDEYQYRRRDLAVLANVRDLLRRNERNIKPTDIDKYRVAGIIPPKLFRMYHNPLKKGYMYHQETVEWVLLGRVINKRSKIDLPTIGTLLRQVVIAKGLDSSLAALLMNLYLKDENYARFLRRIINLGVQLSPDIEIDAAPPT